VTPAQSYAATATPPPTPEHLQQPGKPQKIKRGFDYWRVHVKNDTNIAAYNLAKEKRVLPTEAEAILKQEEMNAESKGMREFLRKAIETRFVKYAQRRNLTYCGSRVLTKSQVFCAIREQLS
jgi:hypothetical protein